MPRSIFRSFYRPRFPGLPALTAAVLLATTGCREVKTSDRSLVDVTVTDAQSLLAGRDQLLGGTKTAALIDPRPVHEWRSAHVPGALHIPYEELRNAQKELAAFDTLIVYGNTYGSPVAVAASKTLLEMGFKDVRTLDGGLRRWKELGFPVAEDTDDE